MVWVPPHRRPLIRRDFKPDFPVRLTNLDQYGLAYWMRGNGGERDDSGNGRSATLSGSVPEVITPWGRARQVAGSSGYFVRDNDALFKAAAPWAIEAVVIPTAINANQAIAGVAESPGHSTHDRSIQLRSDNKFSIYIYDGATKNAVSTTAAEVGKAYHLCGCSDGATIRIFVNGALEGSTAVANYGYTAYSSPDFVIGYGGGDSVFDGSGASTWSSSLQILFVRYHTRALSAAEIKKRSDFWFADYEAASSRPFVMLGTGGTSSAAGSSSGTATVSGVGASINAQAGSSAGSAAVSGVGASTNAQAGSSFGTATVSGVGASIHEAAGASAGTATVSGVGDSTSAGSAAGSSAGAATVSGVGASVHTAVGTSAGSSTAGGVSSAIERMTSGGLSRSRNRNRKRYLINGRVYRLTQSELVELLAQRRGDVKPETIKVERSQKPRLNRNRMTAQPTGSVDRRRRASIEITLNPMETQFKPLTKADYMALAEAVEMLIDEQDMMDLLAYL
jgi:hypothetical protein